MQVIVTLFVFIWFKTHHSHLISIICFLKLFSFCTSEIRTIVNSKYLINSLLLLDSCIEPFNFNRWLCLAFSQFLREEEIYALDILHLEAPFPGIGRGISWGRWWWWTKHLFCIQDGMIFVGLHNAYVKFLWGITLLFWHE